MIKYSKGIIPYPVSYQENGGTLSLGSDSRIIAGEESLIPAAKLLANDICKITNLQIYVIQGETSDNSIVLQIDTSLDEEEYTIDIGKNSLYKGRKFEEHHLGRSIAITIDEYRQRQ